jgi:hypothetical protein
LPNWPLIAGNDIWDKDLSEDDRSVLRRALRTSWRVDTDAIVTSAGIVGAGDFNVLIRADGGMGLPSIPKEALTAGNDEDNHLLLVDFNDRDNPVARMWSRMRRQAYSNAGWHVVGESVLSPLEQWQAERPKVIW